MEFVLIPSGTFLMGASEKDLGAQEEAKPQHLVKISRPFYFAKYETTFQNFKHFVEETKYKTEVEKNNHSGYGYDTYGEYYRWRGATWKNLGHPTHPLQPVVNVSAIDAREFCHWMSRKEKKTYRLPTEAEWEYACRAGTRTRYYFGDNDRDLKKMCNASNAFTIPFNARNKWTNKTTVQMIPTASHVGQYKPNPFGLYDMLGNVGEWCDDGYRKYEMTRSGEPIVDPRSPRPKALTLPRDVAVTRRGGSWESDLSDVNPYCRERLWANDADAHGGFRVVLEVESAAEGNGK